MESTPVTKRTRAMPRVWKRVYQLEANEGFEFKGRTYTACFLIFGQKRRGVRLFMPWTKVRTFQYVRDARPGGKSSERMTSLGGYGTTVAEGTCSTSLGSCCDSGNVN